MESAHFDDFGSVGTDEVAPQATCGPRLPSASGSVGSPSQIFPASDEANSDPSWLRKDDFIGTAIQSVPVRPSSAVASAMSALLSLPGKRSVVHREAEVGPTKPRQASIAQASTSSVSEPALTRMKLSRPQVDLDFGDTQSVSDSAKQARSELAVVIENALAAGWETSTRETYDSGIKSVILDLERRIEAPLLPMDTSSKLMTVCGALSGHHWSQIRLLKSAIRAWHVSRGLHSPFDELWDDQASLFWAGLKKKARHEENAKRPVEIDELQTFCARRHAAGTEAGVRDANMANVCFFGIRRSKETLSFLRSELTFQDSWAVLYVSKQKNDPCGKGMQCIIPRILTLGAACPCAVLEDWARRWDAKWIPLGYTDGPLFFTTGKKTPLPVSYDVCRKAWKTGTGDQGPLGTHSLRKGGAKWYRQSGTCTDDAIQIQGGWARKETMLRIYARETHGALQRQLASASQSLCPSV